MRMVSGGMSRREFLKLGGATSAALGLGGLWGLLPAGEIFSIHEGLVPESWKKGVCRYCGTGCGVELGVAGGRVVAIRGLEDYPVNKGVLCLKGLSLMYVVHSEERALHPLIRNGDGFARASWDQSLDLVAQKLKETVERHGPESVGLYLGAQLFTEEMYLANKLFKGVLSSNNVEANARLCMASAVTGFLTTFGKDEPPGCYADIEHADCFFLIGANLAEQHPIVFGRILKRRAANRGVKIIVADPRMTPTAAHADLWLPFFPGTDLALLNSMAQVLVEEGRIDRSFVDAHTRFVEGGKVWGPEKQLNFEEFKSFLADYTPEKIAGQTGVPAEDVRRAARLFGSSRTVMSLWTMGLNQRRWGTWANNLVYNLHLLSGKICVPGSTALSMTGQPNACGGVREAGCLSHVLPAHRGVKNARHRAEMEGFWGLPPGSIGSKPGPHTVKMFEQVAEGKIKFLWVACSNPAQSLPDVNKFLKGMSDVFLVVQDVFPPTQVLPEAFPNLTAELADVFLPTAFWVEKGGVFGNTERRSSFTERAVEPPEGLLADWEIFAEVGRRMGHGKHFKYDSTRQIWDEYRGVTAGTDMDLSGATYEKMLRRGGVQWPSPDVADPGSGRRFVLKEDLYLQRLAADGKVAVPADGVYFYGHPDGRAKIFKRPQMPPAEVPDGEYPLYLTTGRVVHHWHTGTMTMRAPWLKRAVPGAFAEFNPEDAAGLGVADGDEVAVITRRGRLELPARVPELSRLKEIGLEGRVSVPRPGVVFIPFFDATKLVNLLTVDAVDGMSKEPEYKICACRVERVKS
ncbi:MAG: molybdopterin oxidoreductase family protein [Planctomycetota bacterium]|jgi:nitrate reductase NapA